MLGLPFGRSTTWGGQQRDVAAELGDGGQRALAADAVRLGDVRAAELEGAGRTALGGPAAGGPDPGCAFRGADRLAAALGSSSRVSDFAPFPKTDVPASCAASPSASCAGAIRTPRCPIGSIRTGPKQLAGGRTCRAVTERRVPSFVCDGPCARRPASRGRCASIMAAARRRRRMIALYRQFVPRATSSSISAPMSATASRFSSHSARRSSRSSRSRPPSAALRLIYGWDRRVTLIRAAAAETAGTVPLQPQHRQSHRFDGVAAVHRGVARRAGLGRPALGGDVPVPAITLDALVARNGFQPSSKSTLRASSLRFSRG